MKRRGTRGAVAALLLLIAAAGAQAADSVEAQIRALEQQQCRAALAGDLPTLEGIFADDYEMVNPAGQLATRAQLLALLGGATHPYRTATYTTDVVRNLGKVVVTIGREEVVANQGPEAGKRVQRRVTQVWVRKQGAWRLSVRQAMVVPGA
jgi:uncharacterized protein (TIGR02246 family)